MFGMSMHCLGCALSKQPGIQVVKVRAPYKTKHAATKEMLQLGKAASNHSTQFLHPGHKFGSAKTMTMCSAPVRVEWM